MRRSWWWTVAAALCLMGCSAEGFVSTNNGPDAGGDVDDTSGPSNGEVGTGPSNGSDTAGGEPSDESDGSTPPRRDGSSSNEPMDDGGSSDEMDANDSAPTTCNTSLDGPITRSEVPLKTGSSGIFDAAGIQEGNDTVEVDTDGQSRDQGSRVWNLAPSFPGDETKILALQDPTDMWFHGEFDGEADYAMRLSQDPDDKNLGVFKVTQNALLLLGVVSPDDGLTRTIMRYEPPAQILEFPIEKGGGWSSTSTVSGRYNGTSFGTVPGTSLEVEYRSQVDMEGVLKTPFAPNEGMEVLRVQTVVDRRGDFGTFPLGTVRTFAFVSPCFGTVATIRSERNEEDEEFKEADEVRRLSTR